MREKRATAEKKRVNYYPFGLKHKGYNDNISSLGNHTAQKFKYNGVEYEEALGLNLYEMKYRHYDPSIGRWLLIDPRVENLYALTPYNAFLNDPVRYSDPDGDIPPQLIAGAIGALWEYGNQVYGNYKNGDSGYKAWVGNVDFADVVTEGVATGVTLGLNKVKGSGATVVTEFVKASIDIKGNGDTDVIGFSDKKDVGSVLTDTAKNSIVEIIGGEAADALLSPIKKQVSKSLNKAIDGKANAYHKLEKTNNIRKTGNANKAARGSQSKIGTSNQRFQDVVKADKKLQVASKSSQVVNSTAVEVLSSKAGATSTGNATEWIDNIWNY